MSQIIVSGSQTVSSSTTNQYVIESGGVLSDKNGGNISATQVQSGGTLVVNSGTEAGAVVSSGGVETISAGSASSDSIYGAVTLAGGSASAEQVYGGGNLTITGGNTAANTVLEGGGTVELATSGATLSGSLTFANGSNTLKLDKFTSAKTVSAVTLSGFSSTDEILIEGAYVSPTLSYATGGNGATSVTISTTTGGAAVTETFIFAGGAALNALDVLSSSNAIAIVSGQGQTVGSGQTLIVQSGGAAASTTVLSGGTLLLSGGGATGTNTTLVSGGTATLATSGAVLSGALTLSGLGDELIVKAIASSGAGDQAVISGFTTGDKIDVTVISSSGAALSFATSGGNEVVTLSGAAGSESFIFAGASQVTSNTLSLVADGAGVDLVYAGGQTTSVTTSTASGAYTVSSGNTLLVLSGGAVSAASVLSGGVLAVDGGVDAGASVAAGGAETVSAGSASGDQIFGNAVVASGAQVSGETVESGGALVVSGSDASADILAGGVETVAAGGSASGDQVYGAIAVSGGTLSGATIESGGSATLVAGAVDSGMTVMSGAQVLVSAATGSATLTGDLIGGVVSTISSLTGVFTSETVIGGGVLNLANSNNATDTTVESGGELVLSGKETATDTVLISGGVIELLSPKASLAGSITLEGGGNTIAFDDMSSATYGDNAVISGFSATDQIEISSAAFVGSSLMLSQSVSGGDTIAQVLSAGAVVETIAFAGSGLNGDLSLVSDGNGGSILEITQAPGTTYVNSATASGAFTVSAGATLDVLAGGGVTAPTVEAGGFLVINGGQDTGATIEAGALETVSAGSAGGDQIFGSAVDAGGVISGAAVQSGGALTLQAGSAVDTVLDGGASLTLSGASATLSGSVTFANGGNALVVSGLNNAGAGDQAVISGMTTTDKIEVLGVGSGAALSFAAGPGNEQIATVSGSLGSASFVFGDGSTYNAGTMSLAPDGSGVDLVLDATPTVAFTSLSGLQTNSLSQIVNGTVDVGVDPEAIGTTVSVFENNQVVGQGVVGANGYWSAGVTLLNADGANSLSATDTDKAGNGGATSQSLTYNVNTTAPAFIPGDLVVSISGDGDGSGVYGDNQGSPITLEQITTTGAIVSQLVLPQETTTVNGVTEYAVSGEYGSSSEGALQLSADGHSLVIAGYGINYTTYNAGGAAVYGNAALAQTTSVPGGQYTAVARVVADINADGVVDSSTALYNVYNENNPRSVATVDGTSFYLAGQGVKGDTTQGVFYAVDGASSATSINDATDTRGVQIYDGQLYVSSDSKQGVTDIADYGPLSALSPPSGQVTPTVLPGISGSVTLTATNGNTINDVGGAGAGTSVNLSPESYFFANATTLYVADGGDPKEGGEGDGGLQKWTYSGGQWTLQYTLSQGLNLVSNTSASGTSGLIDLTGQVESDGSVELYATNSTLTDLGQTYLYEITDQLSATAPASGESFTTILTASPGENIRGVSFAPSTYTPTLSGVVGQPVDGGAIEVTGTGEAGYTVTLYADGGSAAVGSGLVSSNGTFDITTSTTFSDGAHTLTGTLTNSSGVIGAVSSAFAVSVDPNAPVISGLVGQPVNGGTIEVQGTGEAGETVTLYADGGSTAVGAGVVTASGTFDITTSAIFADGQHSLTATLTDGAALTGAASSAFSVAVDPNAPTISGLVGQPVNGGTIEVLGTGEAGETVTLYADGGSTAVGSGVVTASGTFDITTSATFVAGQHSLTATQTDSAGLSATTASAFVYTNGAAVVSSGVSASGTTILSGGSVRVLSGGAEIGATVAAGGTLYVSSGGVASGTLVSAGGSERVSNGGSASGTVIASGGAEYVTVGGIESGAILSSGGNLYLSSGGVAEGAVLLRGGSERIMAGGTGSGTVVSSGGAEYVSSGGVERGALVSAGGDLYVSSGGGTQSSTLFGGAAERIMTGGVGSGTVISSGGAEYVSSGGVESGALVSSGGNLYVSSGGMTQSSTILGGATERVMSGGSASGSVIKAGGGEYVSVGGLDSGAVVSSGGALYVSSGGAAQAATVLGSGTDWVLAGGTASGMMISSGGSERVYASAAASGSLIGLGGAEYVLSGGVESGAVVSGTAATLYVSSGGLTRSVSVSNGGSERLLSGGVASGTLISSGGAEYLSSGGIDSGAQVLSGGNLYVSSGGVARSASVLFGGTERVTVGGTGSGTTISSGGAEYVSSGGVESGALVSAGGNLYLSSGGTADDASVLYGGTERVMVGGAGNGTVLSSGGAEYLSSGGVESGALVSAGGNLYLSSGGVALSATVFAGGAERVMNGATASATIVSSGGAEYVSSGGTASGAVILSGGSLIVSSGGILSGGVTVSGGTVTVASGAVTSGAAITFVGSGGDLVLSSPTTFSGTIAGMSLKSQKVDLSGIAYSTSGETVSWTEAASNTSGTLTVSSGGQVASLNLLGSYVTSNFALSTDGHGGTYVADPPLPGQSNGVASFAQAMATFGANAAVANDHGLVASSSGPFTSHFIAPGVMSAAHG